MKPTVDNILAKYNIRPYNGSWYVTEKKLREVLAQIIEDVYEAGIKSTGESSK
jgi:alpha-galactosidase